MAGFKTHLVGGVLTAAAVSSLGLTTKVLTLTQGGAVFLVGIVGGLLPDLDSDTGKPLALLFQIISVLIPSTLFFTVAQYGGNSAEFLLCYFAVSYLFIHYVVCHFVKKMTVHRGMMHSLPFAVLCGGLGYLLFVPSSKDVAFFAGIAVFLGSLLHLFLDEMGSFTLKFGFIPAVKKSGGSALKVISNSLGATLVCYGLVILVFVTIVFFFPP